MPTGAEERAQTQGPAVRRAPDARWLAGLGAFVASRMASIATTAVNWDEFALLDRVARTARAGVPETGGRPGLAEWLLLPIVSACSDEIATVQHARWLWLGLTLCFLAGLYALLRRAAARAAAAPSRCALRCRPARARPRLSRVVAPGSHGSARARRRRLGRDAAAGLAAARAPRARGRDRVRRRLPGIAEASLRGGARRPARGRARLARARRAPGARGDARDALPRGLRARLRGLPRGVRRRVRRAARPSVAARDDTLSGRTTRSISSTSTATRSASANTARCCRPSCRTQPLLVGCVVAGSARLAPGAAASGSAASARDPAPRARGAGARRAPSRSSTRARSSTSG